jgi:Protein of unknown function (DUF1572)
MKCVKELNTNRGAPMPDFPADFLADVVAVYRKHKEYADGALRQLDADEAFFRPLGPRSPSVAVVVKHVAGNLRSRWRDFLTSDGEKPDRDRDGEFVITPQDTRPVLMAAWEEGWAALFTALAGLTPADLGRTITIRGEPHAVFQALNRSLAHTAYHVGQITYLCRTLKEGDWQWLTIAPGQSRQVNAKMRERFPGAQ